MRRTKHRKTIRVHVRNADIQDIVDVWRDLMDTSYGHYTLVRICYAIGTIGSFIELTVSRKKRKGRRTNWTNALRRLWQAWEARRCV